MVGRRGRTGGCRTQEGHSRAGEVLVQLPTYIVSGFGVQGGVTISGATLDALERDVRFLSGVCFELEWNAQRITKSGISINNRT